MQGLCLFKIGKFLDQLFHTETWKTDRQFYIVARAFAAENEAFAILAMANV